MCVRSKQAYKCNSAGVLACMRCPQDQALQLHACTHNSSGILIACCQDDTFQCIRRREHRWWQARSRRLQSLAGAKIWLAASTAICWGDAAVAVLRAALPDPRSHRRACGHVGTAHAISASTASRGRHMYINSRMQSTFPW